MLSFLITLISFIVAILILVSLHEFGHYIVARWCGIKVLRFSVGFGKPFYTKKRGETEWCLAPIPLGGYVKMVDTREGKVKQEDLPYAFDKQHPAKRIAVVVAGPLTNLVLAILLYGISFSFGVIEIKPFVGMVETNSIAAQAGFQAGDKIQSVNGQIIKDWGDAQTAMILDLDSGVVKVAVEMANGQAATRVIDAAGTAESAAVAKNSGNIGLWPFKLTTTLAMVAPNSPAERAGLQKGDKLLAVDGQTIQHWQQWVDLVRNSPGQKRALTYERAGKILQTEIRPNSEEQADGSLIGKVGLAPERDAAWDDLVRHQYYPSMNEAFGMAWDKTVGYSTLTLKFFGKLLTGQASTNHISGPLTIADVAGKSAAMGVQSYLEFLALVSVSLGILNLLPIPVLDGGHLVYYTAEWIRGKPLSERVQNIGLRFGLAVMLMLMCLAFFNDITRLFG